LCTSIPNSKSHYRIPTFCTVWRNTLLKHGFSQTFYDPEFQLEKNLSQLISHWVDSAHTREKKYWNKDLISEAEAFWLKEVTGGNAFKVLILFSQFYLLPVCATYLMEEERILYVKLGALRIQPLCTQMSCP
jgi:hypothetical protein